uniref:(northern house mosquito) hypothetical protein n=1 Tax=Culex pipiens TaxID=7175 RepID=A0A8D8I345_CULPI
MSRSSAGTKSSVLERAAVYFGRTFPLSNVLMYGTSGTSPGDPGDGTPACAPATAAAAVLGSFDPDGTPDEEGPAPRPTSPALDGSPMPRLLADDESDKRFANPLSAMFTSGAKRFKIHPSL